MLSSQEKKGMWAWLTKHPILTLVAVVFLALMIAAAVAMVLSASSTSVQASLPSKKRKHPAIAGAAVHMPVVISPSPAPTIDNPLSKWRMLLFQLLMVLTGVVFSLYLVNLLTSNF